MSETTKEVKPCPFCGGKAVVRILQRSRYVECKSCYALSGCYADIDKAIEVWNRRQEPTK